MFREFAMPCNQFKQQSTNEIYNYMRSTRLQAILITVTGAFLQKQSLQQGKKRIYIYIYIEGLEV